MENDQLAARVIARELMRHCPDRMLMFAGLKDEPDVCFDLDKKTPIIWFDIALRRLGVDKTARVNIKAAGQMQEQASLPRRKYTQGWRILLSPEPHARQTVQRTPDQPLLSSGGRLSRKEEDTQSTSPTNPCLKAQKPLITQSITSEAKASSS